MSLSYQRTRLLKNANLRGPGPFEAIIINHLDPHYQGSLEVEILRQNAASNTPQRSGQLVKVKYLSPFYGVTPVNDLKSKDGFENSQQSYGMWAVPPDYGTRVLVIFAEGNSSNGYWIGCIPDHNMNFAVPDGRPSTKNTTEKTPKELKGKKLPVGEYNKAFETGEKTNPSQFARPYNKDFTSILQIQGLLEDEARGTTTTSAVREVPSMVFGLSTPGPMDKRQGSPKAHYGETDGGVEVPFNRLGGSSFVMDDGDDKLIRATHAEDGPPIYVNRQRLEEGGDETIPHNELLRFRTRTGHQILLHNSEDLIYIANSRGTAWIELSSDGKIDIHAQDSISVMTDTDLNFTAERDINMEAGRNVNVKASARWSDYKASEAGIESGRVQIESLFDTNILAERDYNIAVKGNNNTSAGGANNFSQNEILSIKAKHIYLESEGDIHLKSAHSFYRTSGSNMYDFVEGIYHLDGEFANFNIGEDINTKVGNTINTTAGQNILNKTIVGDIQNVAQKDIVNETLTADTSKISNLSAGTIHHKSTGELDIESSLVNIKATDSYIDGNLQVKSTADISALTAGSVNGTSAGGVWSDTGSGDDQKLNSHSFSFSGSAPTSIPAALAKNTKLPLPNKTASGALVSASPGLSSGGDNGGKANGDSGGYGNVMPLSTHTLPYVFPGNPTPTPYQTIVPRAPQHEPWPHHENLNPVEFKRDKTDRESIGTLTSTDVFIAPDAFDKGKSAASSIRVLGTGGNITSSTISNSGENDEADTMPINRTPSSQTPPATDPDYRPYSGTGQSYGRVKYGEEGVNRDPLYYTNSNKARRLRCEQRLEDLLIKVALELDVKVEIFSGGQMPKDQCLSEGGWEKTIDGQKGWVHPSEPEMLVGTGSPRHNFGSAADIRIYENSVSPENQILWNTALGAEFGRLFIKYGGSSAVGGYKKNGRPYMKWPSNIHVDIVGTDRAGTLSWLNQTATWASKISSGRAQQTTRIRSAFA